MGSHASPMTKGSATASKKHHAANSSTKTIQRRLSNGGVHGPTKHERAGRVDRLIAQVEHSELPSSSANDRTRIRRSEQGAPTIQRAKGKFDAEIAEGLDEYDHGFDDEEFDDEEEHDAAPLLPQLTTMSCGIAAVQMVLATKGVYAEFGTLIRLSQDFGGAYDDDMGTTTTNMAAMLKHLNQAVEGPRTMSLTTLIEKLDNGPVIVRADQHFVVLDSVAGNAPILNELGTVATPGTRTFSVRDPWPPGVGTAQTWTEAEFQDETTAWYVHY